MHTPNSCSTTNPLYNPKGNQCVNCDEPFYFSFVSFEALPLVRIRLADDISDSEAAELLLQSGVSSGNLSQSHLHSSSSPAAIAGNASSVNVNVLRLEDETGSIQTVPNDAISVKQQMDEAFNMFGTQRYDREMLTRLPSSEVIVLKWAKPLRYEFLRNLVPEMHITNCDNCNKLFLTEELESHVIQHRCCPFCRKSMSTLDSK